MQKADAVRSPPAVASEEGLRYSNGEVSKMNRQTIQTEKAPAAVGPYAQAVKINNFLFTSGQIPINPETGEIEATDIEAQTARVLDNLSAVLIAAGSGLKDVVKTTVFIKNMNDFATVNRIYARYFDEPYPARSCVEISRLPNGALVEIEAVAVCP